MLYSHGVLLNRWRSLSNSSTLSCKLWQVWGFPIFSERFHQGKSVNEPLRPPAPQWSSILHGPVATQCRTCSRQGTCWYVICQMANYCLWPANWTNSETFLSLLRNIKKETGWGSAEKGGRTATQTSKLFWGWLQSSRQETRLHLTCVTTAEALTARAPVGSPVC